MGPGVACGGTSWAGCASCAAVTATNSTGDAASTPTAAVVTARPVTRSQARAPGRATTSRTSRTSPAATVAITAVYRLPAQATATQSAPGAQCRSCRHQSPARQSSGSETSPHSRTGSAAPSAVTHAQSPYPAASRARSRAGPGCSRPSTYVIRAEPSPMVSSVTRNTARAAAERGNRPVSSENGFVRPAVRSGRNGTP